MLCLQYWHRYRKFCSKSTVAYGNTSLPKNLEIFQESLVIASYTRSQPPLGARIYCRYSKHEILGTGAGTVDTALKLIKYLRKPGM